MSIDKLSGYLETTRRLREKLGMATHFGHAAIVCIMLSVLSVAAASVESSPKTDVTSGSAQGWSPSQVQRNQVTRVIEEFLADLDEGKYLKAYGLMSASRRAAQSLDDFEKLAADFNAEAGPVIYRRIVHISWTKDPANAPTPGVYVSVDLISKFAKVDRDCGYIILYQGNRADPFLVQGEERAYLSNLKAQEIQERTSREYVENLWSRLATSTCPNYLGSVAHGTR